MDKIYTYTIESPVGYLKIVTDDDALLSVSFTDKYSLPSEYQPDILKATINQLAEYFKGTRKTFNLKLNPAGSDFQLSVWEKVKNVQFGKTLTYLDIAIQTGSKNNTRAVGLANGKNPIPIIIPCHRIIGTNGKLTGYSGGLDNKKWLLRHEQLNSQYPELLF